MPEMDGFQVLERIAPDSAPAIISVTAFDRDAIKAFEVCALDYLLKPFDRERFSHALARGRVECERRRGGRPEPAAARTDRGTAGRQQYLDRLVIRSGGRVFFLRADELDRVEAAGNDVRLHREGAKSTCTAKPWRGWTLRKAYRDRLQV